MEKELIKGVYNQVFIHVPKEEQYIEKQGRFDVDVSYDPAQHVKGVGHIVGIPSKVGGTECEGITVNFDIGDECIFHYTVISDQNDNFYVGEYDEKDIYRCELFNLIATRKEGDSTWNMIGGWVFCDPYFEQKTRRIKYTDPIFKNEHTVNAVIADSGIITSVDPKASTRIAKLISIGPNVEGFPELDVEPGELVIFRQGMDSKMVVDGREVFFMRQEELLAKYTPE